MNIKFSYKISLYVVALLLTTSFLGCNLDETQEVVTSTNLVWEDNFDEDGAPDPLKWIYEIGDGSAQGIPGWGNNELQYYTDRLENVSVESGALKITARQESYEGSNYTSARLITKGLFQKRYGRFEARIKLPTGQGLWPAFWLLGDDSNGGVWPQIGEIDIMEYLGNEPTQVLGTVHGPQFSGSESISKELVLENDRFDTGFHIFGIEWSPNKINFYVDDKLYQTITPEVVDEETDGEGEWVFNDRPFYIILNVAVGGNLPGPPNDETMFPQSMYVDYVRVYN